MSLSKRQVILLNSYFDGECSWIQRFLAKRLLKRQIEARQYLTNLNKVGVALNREFENLEETYIDVWDKVEDRIELERRALIYKPKATVNKIDNRFAFYWWGALASISTAVGVVAFIIASEDNSLNMPNKIALSEPIPYVVTVDELNTVANVAYNSKSAYPNYEEALIDNNIKVPFIRKNTAIRSLEKLDKKQQKLLPPFYLRRNFNLDNKVLDSNSKVISRVDY